MASGANSYGKPAGRDRAAELGVAAVRGEISELLRGGSWSERSEVDAALKRIQPAAAHRLANAALIKLNQVGTVSETLGALRQCRELGWGAVVSHRSGETPDDFIADLAVGSGCGQIKSGAPARGERVAKYNRLMVVEHALRTAPYGRVPHPAG